MKRSRFIVFLVISAFLLSSPSFAFWGDKAKAEEESPKFSYKFDDAEEMTEFEQLYVAKQATFGRMGVLQAYFAMEQNNLAEIDRQMEERFGFKMDPNKMYNLNRDGMEIIEMEIPAAENAATE